MADRVDATIQIGGTVPANRIEDLLDAIQAERLGPDWEERFCCREDLRRRLGSAEGPILLYGREVASGEFDDLQALCVEIGLTYVLSYDGYGAEWSPARRIWRPGSAGDGETCALSGDGGRACVTADDLRHHGFADLDALAAYLKGFDDPDVPGLVLELLVSAPLVRRHDERRCHRRAGR